MSPPSLFLRPSPGSFDVAFLRCFYTPHFVSYPYLDSLSCSNRLTSQFNCHLKGFGLVGCRCFQKPMTRHLFTKRTRPASFTRLASGKTSGTGSEAALARGHRQPLVSALTFVEGAEWGIWTIAPTGSGAAADRRRVLGNVMNRLLNVSLYSANPPFQGFFRH